MKNNIKNLIKEISLKRVMDSNDGVLSIAESENQIPFPIKRVYYIYDFKEKKSKRGFHAHKNLKQVIFSISGHFKLTLDDGYNKCSHILKDPNKGVYIDKWIWHTMDDFSKDCIIIVFASDLYQENDYIRNYNDFIKYINSFE